MPKPSSKREPWFRAAVEITDRLNIGGNGRYACPICLRWFADPDDLTREHAPPHSIGGRRVALTCASCNSSAGATVDAQLKIVEIIRDFGQQKMTTKIPTTFSINGVTTNAEMLFGPSGLKIAGIPKQNDPKVAVAQTAVFEELVETGETAGVIMSVTLPGADFRLAAIGWLRAAYLLSFAALGYRYILRPELNILRQQIREPDVAHLERFAVMGRLDPPDPTILIVKTPRSLESVVVFMRDTIVFLPGLRPGPSIYERLAARKRWPPRLTKVNAAVVPIPKAPSIGLMDR